MPVTGTDPGIQGSRGPWGPDPLTPFAGYIRGEGVGVGGN